MIQTGQWLRESVASGHADDRDFHARGGDGHRVLAPKESGACAKPKHIVITTLNREYNVKWETLPAGKFRHRDHRFEWTRAEFQEWANHVAARFSYKVRFLPIGPEDAAVGSPTKMVVFERTTNK